MSWRSVSFVLLAGLALLVTPAAAGCPFAASRRGQQNPHQSGAGVADAVGGPSSRTSASTAGNEDGGLGPWMGQIPVAGNTSDPLVSMNDLFHQLYTAVGVDIRPDPVVMLEGDYVVLRRNHTRALVKPFTPPIYHYLKMVCHMPLGVFVILEPLVLPTNDTQTLDATTRARLTAYLDAMVKAQAGITAARYPAPGQVATQFAIAKGTANFAREILSQGTVSYAQASAFTQSLMPNIQKNVLDAGAAQVDMLHAVMEQIKGILTAEEWEAMRVIVNDSHMARAQNLASQFFARYFNVDIFQSHRFITLEQQSSEADVLKLMDTHETDYGVGGAFFDGYDYRMHEDLLCHAAKLRLDQLFPETAHTTIGCFNSSRPIQ